MNAKLLTEYQLEFLSLKVSLTGSSESTLVKLPHCWKSHSAAHMLTYFDLVYDENVGTVFLSKHSKAVLRSISPQVVQSNNIPAETQSSRC